MKNQKARPAPRKHIHVLILIPTLLMAAAMIVVPVYSARSGLLTRDGMGARLNARKSARLVTARTTAQPTSSPETIATFAADCTTAKSTFFAGETVCAKTDNVAPLDGSWWVNWILLDTNTVVNGGDHVNPVSTNPQTFTYAPTTPGSYKVSLSNVPGDPSQTPAGFTVVAAPQIATYSGDCTTAKADFNLGQTICIKTSGLSNTEFPGLRVQVTQPDGFVLQRFNLTDNSQSFTYTLPTATTDSIGSDAIDYRGTWTFSLSDRVDSDLQVAVPVVVHKSNLLVDRVADLQIAKVWLGDPVEAGQLITFQIFVVNQGPDPATNIRLSDLTLPNTTFHSFTQQGLIASNFLPGSYSGYVSEQMGFGGSPVRFLTDSGSNGIFGGNYLAPTPTVTFTCTSPADGSAGTTNCTADGLQVGEGAFFTAVYRVNSNISNGAVLTDDASATVASDTTDQRAASNTAGEALNGSNSAPPTCTLTCPGNMTVTADTTGPGFDSNGDPATVPGANVSFSATTSGTCGTITSTPTSGSFFPLGTTPVSISDSTGASCDFLVTVVSSGSAVTISCPAAVTANAGASCETTVSLGTPTTTGDNVVVTGNRSDGRPLNAAFPAGITTVHWTASNTSGSESCDQQVIVVDTTPPVINNPTAASADANCQAPAPDMRAFVTDNCACDSQDTADSCIGHPAVVVTQDVAPGTMLGIGPHSISVTANDLSEANGGTGNVTTRVVTFNVVDTTAPVITSCPTNVTVYLPLNSTAVSMPVSYSAATATDNCDSSVAIGYSQASGSVFPVGTTTVTVTATDDANNSSTCAFTVTVLYDFTGFFSPVNNTPTLNVVNAGRAIPVKFSLSGDKGLGIFAVNSPYTVGIACDGTSPQTDVTETLTAGGSSLGYSPDTYNYIWKTDSSWAGTCRQLVVKLNDGSSHVANFKFR